MKQFHIILILIIAPVLCANSQVFFSEYAEGSFHNKYLEIYNHSSETVDLSEYAFPSCSNGCDQVGEWDYMNLFPEGASIDPGEVYVITHPNATNLDHENYTEEIAQHSDHTFAFLSNGDDIFAIINISSGNIIDIIGDFQSGEDPGSGFDVAGVTNATKDHTLVRKSSIQAGNEGNWLLSAGTSAEDSEWIVLGYDDSAANCDEESISCEQDNWTNLGFHEYDNANQSTFGCTDISACNYDQSATEDDGTCEYVTDCLGECGGSAYVDGCGICDNDPLNDCLQPLTGCSWCELAANYFDFTPLITNASMTLFYTPENNSLLAGDVIGVFYSDFEGYIKCGGSQTFENGSLAIAAWEDNIDTYMTDGFQTGEAFLFLVLRDDIVYQASALFSDDSSFSNTFNSGGFGQIEELTVGEQFIDECVLPLGLGQDCSPFFNISENEMLLQKLVTTDLYGRNIKKSNLRGLVFQKYSDGRVKRNMILNH